MSTPEAVISRSLMVSLHDAFKIQASTEIRVTDVEKVDLDSFKSIGVIAALGMHGSAYTGTLALGFPDATFLGVISKMLGENYPEVTEENADAASELLNIIYASARVKINEAGNDFAPAIPTTTRGSNVKMSYGGGSNIIRLVCDSEFGQFYLVISLRRTKL